MIRTTALCVALLTGGVVSAQGARNRSLEDAVALLAKDIKEGLGGAKQEVILGTFGAHPKSNVAVHANPVPELIRLLTAALAKLDVKVAGARANHTVTGAYREIDETSTGMLGVKLEFTLTDKEADKQREYSQFVTNQKDVAKLFGVSHEVPPGADAKAIFASLQQEAKKFNPKSPEKPTPALDQFAVLPAAGSKFAIEVYTAPPKKDPKEAHAVEDYVARKPTDEDGLAFVKIDRGHVYGIQFVNNADFDAAVSLTIDGLSMYVACDKEDPGTKAKLRDDQGRPLHNFVIVPKKSKFFLRGWFINMRDTDEFLVTEYAKSFAAQFPQSAGRVGVITACFHAAVLENQAFPAGEPNDPTPLTQSDDGTGGGARVHSPYVLEKRKIGLLRATVSVRYSK